MSYYEIEGVFLYDCERKVKKFARGEITDMTPEEHRLMVEAVKEGGNSVELPDGMWCLIAEDVVNALKEETDG